MRHVLTAFGFLDGWKAVVAPENLRAVFSEIEARLDERAASEGELRMTVPMLYIESKVRH